MKTPYWRIFYKYPGQPEEVIEDEIQTRAEADYLLQEYELAFRGSGGHVYKRKKISQRRKVSS